MNFKDEIIKNNKLGDQIILKKDVMHTYNKYHQKPMDHDKRDLENYIKAFLYSHPVIKNHTYYGVDEPVIVEIDIDRLAYVFTEFLTELKSMNTDSLEDLIKLRKSIFN